MSVPRVSATALQIASILGLANTQSRVDRDFQCRALVLIRTLSNEFENLTAIPLEALRARAKSELDQLLQHIEAPRRNYIGCLALLDLLWFAPMHRAIRVELEEVVCTSYVNCRFDDLLKADLRAQVRIRERSAFVYVRAAAVRLRQHELPDDRDVARLASTDEQLREARVGVAERIIHFHRRLVEQKRGHVFTALLAYLAAVVEDVGGRYENEERTSVRQVLDSLRELPLPVAQRFVFPEFVRVLRSREIGGKLEKVLADHREAIVDFLRERWEQVVTEPEQREDEARAVLRLLRSLVKFGVEPATQLMFDLIEAGRKPQAVRRYLVEGIQRHVKLAEQRVLDVVDRRPLIRNRCDRLAEREGLHQLAEEIRELLLPTHVSEELSVLLDKLARNEANLKEQTELRDSGNACLARLIELFDDPRRTDEERERLLAFASRLPPKAYVEHVTGFAWRVYRMFPNEREAVRISALAVLVSIGLVPNGPKDTEVRTRLAADLKAPGTTAALRRSIELAWGRLFPASRPVPSEVTEG